MRLGRIALILALALGIAGAPLGTRAQETGRVPRVGVLSPGPTPVPPARTPFLDAFRQGLRDLGYAETRTIVLHYRFADGHPDRLPDLAAELVRLEVDAFVSIGSLATAAAQDATETIPIVMVAVANPVGSGFVASLTRPGGNVTGLSMLAAAAAGKRLEVLKEILPHLSRVAVLWNAPNPAVEPRAREVQRAAQAMGVALTFAGGAESDDLDDAFTSMMRERPDALLVLADLLTSLNRKRIAVLAAKNRLPAMYEAREFVDADGLMAYGPSAADLYRRAATYVDRILKGARPGDLPVGEPTKFDLFINLRAARALGLAIPPSILLRADQVIE